MWYGDRNKLRKDTIYNFSERTLNMLFIVNIIKDRIKNLVKKLIKC